MKNIFCFVLAVVGGAISAAAGGTIDWQKYLLHENFSNFHYDEGNLEPADTKVLFNNPDGWTLNEVYAGSEGLIIKMGGSITTPPLKDLTGNASFRFDGGREWFAPDSEPKEEQWGPHVLTISGGGELSTAEFDPGVSVTTNCMYGVGAETRLTLTASYDMKLTGIDIYYAEYGSSGEIQYGDYTGFSHESGDYFNPFDLALTVGGHDSHNILVYTLDGSEPERTSTRYDGTPIHIEKTTTVRTATIFGNGGMAYDKARTYNFPTASAVEVPENTFEVTVSKPGSLKSQLLDIEADVIAGLTLKGKLNGEDLKYLIGGEGRTASLTYVDISDVSWEYDGTAYRTVVDAPAGGMGTTYVYQYCLGEENREETIGGSPNSQSVRLYRNNLAALFQNHQTIQYVVLPNSLTSLGERIFDQCTNLAAVVLPENLTSVGSLAFYYCQNFELYDFPETFEEIGSYAFAGIKLGNVKLAKKVKLAPGAFQWSSIANLEMPMPSDSIPDSAFEGCKNLEKVSIGEGLKYIGASAFKFTNIKEANFPSSLQEVSTHAFDGAPFINKIEPEGGIRYIGKIAYDITSSDQAEFTVKEGTVSLAPGLFRFSTADRFTLPSTLEIIGEEAFAGTQISSLPEAPALRRINSGAFRNCSNLGRITIPESVEFIDNAFDDCNALWSVTYNAIDAECPSGISPRDLERIVIGDKVRRLPRGLYTGNTNVTEVILPQSVEVLDPYVFSGCSNLEYVRLSDNLTTISESAFSSCRSLANIHWPANLKEIGNSAFSDCSGLKSVSLPEGVEVVESFAFSRCSGVEKLYIASTVSEIGYDAFGFDNAGSDIVITSMAQTPPDYQWNWHYVATPLINVSST